MCLPVARGQVADPACPPQTSFSAPMAESASPRWRCVTVNISVRTNRTRPIVGSKWTAARTTATKTNAVSLRTSCATGRGTARTAVTRPSVVGLAALPPDLDVLILDGLQKWHFLFCKGKKEIFYRVLINGGSILLMIPLK